jgi:hypothetical protein
MKTFARAVVCGAAAVMVCARLAAAETPYEVWAVDQSKSAGKTFGGTLYIYDGKTLERGRDATHAKVERIDLSLAAAALCLAQTGVNPVRPHMIAMNASQTHAVISFVATGQFVCRPSSSF